MKIPIIQATEELKQIPVTATTKGAGRTWDAAEQLSGQVQAIGLDLANRERIAQDTLKAIELDGTMRAKFLGLEESYLKRDDYDNFDKDLPGQIEAIKGEIQPKNPSRELAISFERSFKNYTGNIATSVKTRKYKVMEERGKIALGDDFDRAVEAYSSTEDPVKKAIIKKEFELTASKVANDNLINPLWADKLVKSFDSKSQQVELINGVNSNDPEVIQRTIARSFDKVDPVAEANLKILGRNRIDTLIKKQEEEQNKLKVTNGYNSLKSMVMGKGITITPNQNEFEIQDQQYGTMLEILRNPNIQQKLNLKAEQVNQLSNILEGERKNIRDAGEVKRQEVLKQIGDLTLLHKYGEAKKMLLSPYLTGLDKKTWDTSIDADINNKSAVDDPATYANLLQRVMDPALAEENKVKLKTAIIASGGLKTETKKSLIKDLLEDQLFKDPWFKRSESAIKEGLGWTEQMGFFNLKDPLKAQSSYRDVTNQLITDIKKEGLRGPDIYKRAKELVLPKQMEVWDMLMGGKKSEEKSKEKYEIGKIYTDAQGQKAKYIGNGKWQPLK